jgi:hypothetical protein
MKTFRFVLLSVGLLAALPASAKPKHILISDSLLAHGDQWDVKRNDRWTGMNRWAFGDYAVVASKTGWTHGGTHTNLFETKSESYSENRFSFVMSNQTDSAFVDAAHQTMTSSNPGLKVGQNVHLGGTGQTVGTDRFIASITIGRDTTEMWDLLVGETEVSEQGYDRDDLARHTAVLVHGDRRIALVPVFSRKLDQKPSFGSMLSIEFHPPAMGYEFVEDGHSHCAVEYFSSGASGQYKNTIWMNKSADPRLRLVLAAAMTSVLELKCQEIPYDPDDPNSPKH